MQLLNDPIYIMALPQRKISFEEFILKYTSLIKTVPPQRRWVTIWNIVVAIVILYYFFEIGLVVFFGNVVWQAELNAWWSYLFNFFAILVLIVDIFVALNRGFYRQGILILDRKEIYQHYLRRHCIIDLTGLIVVMMCFFSGSFVLNYVKILFLLKLYNLHLIDVTLQRVLQFHRTRSTAYLVSRLIMIMVMLCHYIGGIFYAIDLYVYNNNYYGPNTPAWCWLYSASAYSQMVIELPWILQYEYTMYWSLATMTTIAYGDITPLNPMETFYVIFVLVISCITFAYILNGIIEILLQQKASLSNFLRQFVTMNQFMTEKLISQRLQVKIRAYFEFIWSEERYRDRDVEQQMISKLPLQLRHQLLTNVYGKFLAELLFKRYFPLQFIHEIVTLIYEYRSSNNEILFQSNSLSDPTAYFLLKGKITFYLNEQITLDDMQFGAFGLYEFFTQSPRQLCAKSNIDSLLYCLSSEKFVQKVREDQYHNQILRYIVDMMRGGKQAEMLGMLCFVCQEGSHLCKQCPYSHYVVPTIALVKRGKLIKQKRLPVRRRQRTKENNLLKEVRNLRRDRENYQQQAQIKVKSKGELTIGAQQQAIFDELEITQTFSNVQEYVKHTELLIKYLKDRVLADADYPDDLLELDQKKDYGRYFPEWNPTTVLRKLSQKDSLQRLLLY